MSAESDFDLDAASLRADGGELSISVEVLASKLEQALPNRTKVQRQGKGLLGKGAKSVREVFVQIGQVSYSLQVQDGRLQGYRVKEVGGIAIKRETLDPGDWVGELTSSLQSEAERSTEARQALQKLIG